MKLTKCFCMLHTDDECFYVGLGHKGQSSRKGNNYLPNDYRPFQCCPTKIERTTRVPKMTAQKLAYKSDNEGDRTRFEFPSSSSKKDSSSGRKESPKYTSSSTSSYKPSPAAKKPAKKTVHDDDDDDIVTSSHDKKESKKSSSTTSKGNKETVKAKPGQKGLLGIAKIVNWF